MKNGYYDSPGLLLELDFTTENCARTEYRSEYFSNERNHQELDQWGEFLSCEP